MSTTPDRPDSTPHEDPAPEASAHEDPAPEASAHEDPAPEASAHEPGQEPLLDPAAVIAGAATQPGTDGSASADATAPARTLEGKEVAPLRATYPRAGNGWILAGLALFVVALMFAFADVTVSERNDTLTNVRQCGTVVSPQDPDDREWVNACDDARGQRLWMVGVPGVLGVLSIGYGLVLRRRPTGQLG